MIGGKGPVIRDLSVKGRYRQEKEKKRGNKKLLALLGLVLLAVLLRPFFFSKQGDDSSEEKSKETLSLNEDGVSRKNIYDRNLEELAISFKISSIYVKPLEFDDIATTVMQLAQVLELDEQELLEELKTQRSFKWLVKNISKEKADKVSALGLPGVYFYEQEERFYPNRINASHVIGDVTDDHGLSGVELFYDNLLRESESEQAFVDAVGGAVGKDLVLTLDVEMQVMLEGEMMKLLAKTKDEEAVFADQTAISALVMGAATGEIFAYAQLPAAGDVGQDLEMAGGLLSRRIEPGMLSLLFEVAAAYNEGRNVLSSEEMLSENIHYLRPRKLKKKRISRKVKWARFKDGTYGSQWLAESLAELGQLPGSGYPQLLNSHYAVDLPGSNGGPGTGINILCSFAGLVNGGRGVAPHFLKAVFSENQGLQEWQWPNANTEIIQPSASKSFIRFLREAAPSSGSVLVAEILFPPKDFILQEELDSVQDSQSGGQEELRQPVIKNGNLIALAAVPAKKPELVMLVTLDGGRFDLTEDSLVKQQVKNIMQKAGKQYQKNRNRKISFKSQNHKNEVAEMWLSRQTTSTRSKAGRKKIAGDKMVDVHGMSLRRALQELESFEVKIFIKGSGVIVRQHPKAGTKLSSGTVVILQAEVVK